MKIDIKRQYLEYVTLGWYALSISDALLCQYILDMLVDNNKYLG